MIAPWQNPTSGDVVIVSHFVAINVLVCQAVGDDRITILRPANASVTEFHVCANDLKILALGDAPGLPDSHLARAASVKA